MITPRDFAKDYPAFADQSIYPVDMIQFWLNFASRFINRDRWGPPGAGADAERTEFDLGQELYAAHQLVLEAEAFAQAENGAPPGKTTGMINNKSADKLSIGYDTGSTAELDAGHWNLTTYGQRFIRLARMFGAGPIQVGYGVAPAFNSTQAWQGPWYANFPNPSGSG